MSDEQKKIYLVTSGEYSDYGINAVFTSREKAEELQSVFGERTLTIEEWPLDCVENVKEKKPYFVRMNSGSFELMEISEKGDPYGFLGKTERDGSDYDGNFYTYVFAEDEKRAVKVCSERLAQAKAEGVLKFDRPLRKNLT